MPRSLQILRARTSEISEWRGTGTLLYPVDRFLCSSLGQHHLSVGEWDESKQMRELVSRCPRGPRSGADVGREVLAGEGGAGGDEVGGCALEDDPAAVVAGAGAEVDDPVGVRHDRLVVLDEDDRLAGVDEPVEQAEQLLDVGEVEAGSRLVEDVDAALFPHVGGQLEPLPLAPG